MTDTPVFFVPTKPLTVVQGINRLAGATGSFRHAGALHDADFNGHGNDLTWNNYRQYYIGEYFWAGRHVFTRGEDFATCLADTLREFDRQGAGASLKVHPKPEDVAKAEAHPRLLLWSQEAEKAANTWRTWHFDEINTALSMERQFGIPHTSHLINSTTVEEYRAKVDAEFARRRKI